MGSPVGRPLTVLNGPQLEQLWVQAGGEKAVAALFAALALQQSSGNVNASNVTAKESSYGLWQINTMASPQYSSYHLTDALTNAKVAVAMSNGGSNLSPWQWTPVTPSDPYGPAQENPVIAAWNAAGGAGGGSAAASAAFKAAGYGAGGTTYATGQSIMMSTPFYGASGAGTPGSSTSVANGCGAKVGPNSAEPNQIFTIPHTSTGLTFCNVKAILGTMELLGGGIICLVAIGFILISQGKSGTPATKMAQGAIRVAGRATGKGSR